MKIMKATVNGVELNKGKDITVTSIDTYTTAPLDNMPLINSEGWLPLDAWETTDFSSESTKKEVDYAEDWHRRYELLLKKLDRIDRYCDDVLKYNPIIKAETVLTTIKSIIGDKYE